MQRKFAPLPFAGVELLIVDAEDGHGWISLPTICAVLGLNAAKQARRIKRNATTENAIRGERLRAEFLYLWLIGVDVDFTIAAERRAEMDAFTGECARVLHAHFGSRLPMSPAELIDYQTEGAGVLFRHFAAERS